MFEHTLLTWVFGILVYYLIGCLVAIIGIRLKNQTIYALSAIILYFPVAVVTIMLSVVIGIITIPIAAVVGIKNIIKTRVAYTGGIREARKLMEEIEAEEFDKDDENDSI